MSALRLYPHAVMFSGDRFFTFQARTSRVPAPFRIRNRVCPSPPRPMSAFSAAPASPPFVAMLSFSTPLPRQQPLTQPLTQPMLTQHRPPSTSLAPGSSPPPPTPTDPVLPALRQKAWVWTFCLSVSCKIFLDASTSPTSPLAPLSAPSGESQSPKTRYPRTRTPPIQ